MKTASSMVMVLIAAGALAPAAWGQDAAPQRTDPDATSPAGVLYEIPLDTGRRDGVPHRDGAGGGSSTRGGAAGGNGGGGGSATAGGGSGTGDTGGSGASSRATSRSGTADGTAAGSPGSGDATSASAAADVAESSIHSENGFGSSTVVPTAAAAVTKSASVQGEGSSRLPEYLLLGLLVAVGVYLGCVSFAPRFRT